MVRQQFLSVAFKTRSSSREDSDCKEIIKIFGISVAERKPTLILRQSNQVANYQSKEFERSISSNFDGMAYMTGVK